MRLLVLVFLALMSFGALAYADEAGEAPLAQENSLAQRSPHGDKVDSNDKAMAMLFWAFAAASVGGALFVVTRKNLIAAVMGMVGSFIGIAAVYMMLYASFLAVLQMLVYAGAIMVLFVFVIMILNRPEDEPVAPSGRAGQVVGGIAILYLIARLGMLLVDVHPPAGTAAVESGRHKLQLASEVYDASETTLRRTVLQVAGDKLIYTPDNLLDITENPQVQGAELAREQAEVALGVANVDLQRLLANAQPQNTPEGHTWGSVRAVGTDLFNGGLFPFEAISILLLVAVVGAIAIARPLKDDPATTVEPAPEVH